MRAVVIHDRYGATGGAARTEFRAGDEVFGVKSGANADYVIDRTYRLDEIVEAVRHVERPARREATSYFD
jgi:hypothetical protein